MTRLNKRQKQVPAQVHMTPAVYEQIRETIGMQQAETGGILGGSRSRKNGTVEVTHFFFDDAGSGESGMAYTPNNTLLNSVLTTQWKPQGVAYLGSIHSHPPHYGRPSPGDEVYAKRILDSLDLPYLLTPIVTTVPDTGSFSLLPYAITRDGDGLHIREQELVVGGKTVSPATHEEITEPEHIPWELFALVSGAGLVTFGIATAQLIKYFRRYQKQ